MYSEQVKLIGSGLLNLADDHHNAGNNMRGQVEDQLSAFKNMGPEWGDDHFHEAHARVTQVGNGTNDTATVSDNIGNAHVNNADMVGQVSHQISSLIQNI
ncbi:hypothetical protein FPZ12_014275 [Amycolatopsis acidicola]|uniref:Uncharacterized protein n=1 Tax=Amycolatopsis acidicola TaxID=2596893 RepID=A0A5N0V6E8_9PSEU|nr:hypothetical protein [Amycolatopsis acidicola]KAA9161314.1 hypothetical protein FPZ12_014275 [Amycolatopsis acidicola]